ncbi:MAG TPA: M23 family metallopeptidase [Micromonosporaceae bacterium]
MRPVRTGRRLLIALVAGLTLMCCAGGTAAAFFLTGLGGNSSTTNTAALGCGVTTVVNANSKLPSIASLGEEQIHNAAIIISVGQQLKVPPRGWVIAIATALQESVLRNLGDLGAANDHDSLGLFQQRPSQGWGTPEQLMDPVYASRKFYQKLLTVHGWERMALTDAAQAVQISAYPDAYAKHEPLATLIVNTLAHGAARAAGSVVDLRCARPGEVAASGWTVPVRGEITSGFRPPDRPTHNGVDLAAGRGTPIHAAAAGVVITATCNAIGPDGKPWGCWRDGSTSVLGCGWYVEILHPGNIITRYCHMVDRPDVVVGQTVAAGEQIGRVGSTGNSSGPHCHFEVHINGDRYPSGAIDPVPFMNQQGAPLGGAP